MKQKAAIMNKGNLVMITNISKMRMNDIIEHAENLKNDPKKKERLEKHECVVCFYGSRIGGAAMTMRSCMACGSDEIYASTATDTLCLGCAKKHELCKRCGGDIKLRVRRKEWSIPNQQD